MKCHVSVVEDENFIVFSNALRRLIIVQTLYLENFSNHLQRMTICWLMFSMKKQKFSVVKNFLGEAKIA